MFVNHWKNLSLSILKEKYEGVLYIEEWKDIEGYEGIYQGSSFGRIKSLSRITYDKNGVINGRQHEKILKQTKDKLNYVRVSLSKESLVKKRQVHILIAKLFISNPENKRTVNHKKGNPLDNRCWMIEWATQQENIQHSFKELKRESNLKGKRGELWPFYNKIHPAFGKRHFCPSMQREKHFRAKKIQCDTLGLRFNCIKDAVDTIGLSNVSIHKVLNGTQIHSNGLVFRYT